MLPLGRVIQRRLLAACAAAALFLVPVPAAAASPADVDALWNQPQGISPGSAFYVVQAWWDDLTRSAQSDPTQRGMDELAQANTDLLNAYTLLQEQRAGTGAQPVAIIDPFLSGLYNLVTGSNAKAPVGAMLSWANQSLLKLEGRGSNADIVGRLLADYQARQLAAERDLHLQPGMPTQSLWTANASRETAMLAKIKGLAAPLDGVAALVADADHATTALAAKQQTSDATGGAATVTAKTKDHGKGATKDDGKGQHGQSGQSKSGGHG
jgi:hypothetical protein